MRLFTYYRSSASYRVRIALNLKGLQAEQVAVNLAQGEQLAAEYHAVNPQRLLPTLDTGEGDLLTQSQAIIEYLEDRYPDLPLLPGDASERAWVRALTQAISADISPLNNLRVLKFLTADMGLTEAQKLAWYRHWIAVGFEAVEKMLNDGHSRHFCHGDAPSMADCFLVPQVYNAERFACDMSPYPTIRRIAAACDELQAFKDAHPSVQPDFCA